MSNNTNTNEIPCSKYNVCRNTNLLINIKKNKKSICCGTFLIICIALNFVFAILSMNNTAIVTETPPSNLMSIINSLKGNISVLNSKLNNRVHENHLQNATDFFITNVNAVSSDINKVSGDILRQNENLDNISFILNEFDIHKKNLETRINVIDNILVSYKQEVNNSLQNIMSSHTNLRGNVDKNTKDNNFIKQELTSKFYHNENNITSLLNKLRSMELITGKNTELIYKNLTHHGEIVTNKTLANLNIIENINKLVLNISNKIS